MGDGDKRMSFISSVFYPWGSSLWLCCFSLENKNLVGFFFFGGVCHWRVGYYLELYYCFFLVQELLWHIRLYFFFPVEAPEETVHWLFSAHHWLRWFFSLSSEGYQSASEPWSCAAGSSVAPEGPRALLSLSSCFLLARDWTRQETARDTSVCPCKLFKKKFNPGLISCDLAVSEFRIHQNITHFCTSGYGTME